MNQSRETITVGEVIQQLQKEVQDRPAHEVLFNKFRDVFELGKYNNEVAEQDIRSQHFDKWGR